ncbi:MAG: response regulator [Alphaproteobacteria bacterium]|nr:MAG: response regulator [Alphaproteobacteria bacterium]
MASILVAEDEAAVRAFVVRGLEAHGHRVTAVADGGAALEALAGGRFDLLLTDIVMPVMDGIALALKASAAQPALKILMMTGYAQERQRAHNLETLVDAVLSKPFTLQQLGNAVAQALRAP